MSYDVTPYATVADYEARYGAVDDTAALLETLKEATVAINRELERHKIDYSNPTPEYAYSLMVACRNMARRAAPEQVDELPLDVTQMSMGAGGYTRSYTLPSGFGQVRVMRTEYPLLGIGGGDIGFVSMAVDDESSV